MAKKAEGEKEKGALDRYRYILRLIRLADHERWKSHLQAMLNFCELQERFYAEKTTDELQEKKIRNEVYHW